ncbi:hypothetical protein [Brachybacterium sp. GPGPB12]|uniref:hypothetical protein n=1 Tax=Brachybacterium sp. GPGPB12 TaxID=3023517 RepID=UPI0031344D3E
MRALAGSLDPEDGDGEGLVPAPSRPGERGLLLQNPVHALVGATVARDAAFGPENAGLPRPELTERATRALEAARVDLDPERAPLDASGGQQQRIALAGALALRPDLLAPGRADLHARCPDSRGGAPGDPRGHGRPHPRRRRAPDRALGAACGPADRARPSRPGACRRSTGRAALPAAGGAGRSGGARGRDGRRGGTGTGRTRRDRRRGRTASPCPPGGSPRRRTSSRALGG